MLAPKVWGRRNAGLHDGVKATCVTSCPAALPFENLPTRERKVAESCKCCFLLIGLSVAIMLRRPESWRFTMIARVQVQREVIHYTSFVSLIEVERPQAIIEPEKS